MLPIRFVRIALIITLVLSISGLSIAGSLPAIGDDEAKMGHDAAIEAEKDHPPVDDAQLSARISAIGTRLAAIANTIPIDAGYGSATVTPFEYSFKIVDGKDVNAYSIPGGHIYIYKGLVDFCETDHELAAVIAHEIAHSSHHHMAYLLKDQSRLDGKMALVMLAGLLAGTQSGDVSNIVMGTQYYKIAKLNGYGQKAEADADMTAIDYMQRAGYNPVGMLTFLERLNAHPDFTDWGIFQTHPRTDDRVKAVKERLNDMGLTINRRAVTTSSTAIVKPVSDFGKQAYDVVIGDSVICKVADQERARLATEKINALFDNKPQIREVKVQGTAVLVRGRTVVELTDDDAAMNSRPATQLAADACEAIKRVIFKQMITEMW